MSIAQLPEVGGRTALTHTDDGRFLNPESKEAWTEWVAASALRNWCLDDPLLDWLVEFGAAKGFLSDNARPDYDERTDFGRFLRTRGREFETGVMRLLSARYPVIQIGHRAADARDLLKANATVAAMEAGAPIIAQAVLRDPQRQTYGMADLLLRADVLAELFPADLSPAEAALPAPGLGLDTHYRAVDIKYRTLDLLATGAMASDALPHMAQVWLYNVALGRVQGYRPPAAYLLGRTWKHGKEHIGRGCLERLGRVDDARVVGERGPLAEIVEAAIDWRRRLRGQGAGWEVLPVPSVPELFPYARNIEDAGWHRSKAEISQALAELTMVPGMNPERRRKALALGLRRWDDPTASAYNLEVAPHLARKTDAVLEANRGTHAPVLPERINLVGWRLPAAREFFVDFETVNSLNDDFSKLPGPNGQPLIFQIGCGWYDPAGEWAFRQFTVDALSEPEEGRIIGEWLASMESELQASGLSWLKARIMHWSPAETSFLSTAYNSAQARHPGNTWPAQLPWFDFLARVVREEPVAVQGAFNFGLKSIAKAMHAAGLIQTSWSNGPTDGLGAMVGAWWCAREAERLDIPMRQMELMQEIGHYNEVDCRAMAEVVGWLRANR